MRSPTGEKTGRSLPWNPPWGNPELCSGRRECWMPAGGRLSDAHSDIFVPLRPCPRPKRPSCSCNNPAQCSVPMVPCPRDGWASSPTVWQQSLDLHFGTRLLPSSPHRASPSFRRPSGALRAGRRGLLEGPMRLPAWLTQAALSQWPAALNSSHHRHKGTDSLSINKQRNLFRDSKVREVRQTHHIPPYLQRKPWHCIRIIWCLSQRQDQDSFKCKFLLTLGQLRKVYSSLGHGRGGTF